MCFAVYIGVNKELKQDEFVADQTDVYFIKLSDEEEKALRKKFSKSNIYYVGSDTICSCGLAFDSDLFDEPEEQINKKSPTRFIELIKELTVNDSVEFYCCWDGDYDSPVEHTQEIDIREISLEKNYFGLTEGEFINFTSKTP
jgi:hypothetical protein